ncbi:MAG: hypothetical protein K4571_17890 [Deltaproteobacteria bacterium]
MIKKAILFIYLAFLIVIAGISIFWVWTSSSLLISCIEAVTDVIMISGVILYLRKVQFRPWAFVFAAAIVLQIFLFVEENFTALIHYVLWMVILAPALYMNAKVAGRWNREIVFKKNNQQNNSPDR